VDVKEQAGEKKPRRILPSQGALNSAAFSSDGRSIVTTREDGAIQIYDAETGAKRQGLSGRIGAKPLKTVQQWATFRRPDGSAYATPLNINSRFVAVEGNEDGALKVWDLTDLKTPPVILIGNQNKLNSLAVSPAGRFIVAVNEDNTIKVWRRAEPEKVFAEFHGHTDLVTGLAFSPDENLLVTASKDKTALAWRLTDPREKPVVMNKHKTPLTSVSFSPDGKWAVTASEDGGARVWVAANGKPVAELRDGAFISVSHARRRFPLNILFPISVGFFSKRNLPRVNSAAFSPDGDYIVTASEDGVSRIWKARSGKSVAILRGHTLGARSAIFTLDGRSIITAGADHTVRLWELCGGAVKLKSICGR
jgi:WD40 repeat protein